MPPSRHQTPSHTSHKSPYSKEKAAGMKGPSRQSSAGSTVATGTTKSSPDKKHMIVREGTTLEGEDTKSEKRKRKKARKERTRERNGQTDVAGTVNDKSEDVSIKEEKVVRARPLGPSVISQIQTDLRNTPNIPPPRQQTHPAPKQSSITNTAPQSNKTDAKSTKLEQKVEKQRIKLKEAEARAAADADRLKKDAERIQELEDSIKELQGALNAKEEAAEGVQGVVDQHLETIKKHVDEMDHVKEILTEAVSCLICSDTLVDPHILSCGHFACRKCLILWFRQPNAYNHEVQGTITENRDMSYRSKICHHCRTVVLRRPTKMYNVYSFLEPLGLLSDIPLQPSAPTPSQDPVADPWANSFPPDRQTYRLHDEEDDTYRCPSCLHEVADNRCDHCDAEFSGDEEDDEFDLEGMEEYDSDVSVGSQARAGGLRRRGARVNIAHVEDVLGSEDDEHNDSEAEDVNAMDGLESASESGSSEFARPRTDIEHPPPIDSEEDDMDSLDGAYAHQQDYIDRVMADTAVRRPRPQQHFLIDSEAEDDEDQDEEMDMYASEGEDYYDSEEDDGPVPRARIMYARPARRVAHDSDGEEVEEDNDSYEDSFIDDGSEEGDTENENDADEMIRLASSDHEEPAASGSEAEGRDEEREEDGAGQVPNMQEIRRRRLEALIHGRRNPRGHAGRAAAPVFDDSGASD